MFKKMSRGLSLIMAIALILSLFVGVMAEGEEHVAEEETVEMLALGDDRSDDNVGGLATPLLSMSYDAGDNGKLTVQVFYNDELVGSEDYNIYRAAHIVKFGVADGLKIQDIQCIDCTYAGESFSFANIAGERAIMKIYIVDEDAGDNPTANIDDLLSVTYERGKYFTVNLTVNVYVDGSEEPVATKIIPNVKRTANHMILANLNLDEYTFDDPRYTPNGSCTISKVNVFTAHENNPVLDVQLVSLSSIEKGKVGLNITRIAPVLHYYRNICKKVNVSWIEDGKTGGFTIEDKGLLNNDFLKTFYIPQGVNVTIEAEMINGYKFGHWENDNSLSQNVSMDGVDKMTSDSNPVVLTVNEKATTPIQLRLYTGNKDTELPEIKKYTITASAGENGKIDPNGAIEVNEGADKEFTITPNEGYEIDTVTVDGEAVTVTDNSYTFTEVQANHTIHATFRSETTTEPELPEQSVYVYLEVAKNIDGEVNGTGKYYTIGEIKVNLPKAATEYGKKNGEAQYETYKKAVTEALKSIVRYAPNKTIDLTNAQWYSLHTADGANDYVKNGTQAWHLDGRIVNPTTYTVTYTDGVVGKEVFKDQKFDNLLSGAATPGFKGTPAREDYTFAGWNPAVAEIVTKTVTYTAKWEKVVTPPDPVDKYTLTYKDGTATLGTQQYLAGENITAIEDPTKTDYTFKGWESADHAKMPAKMPANDLTVYAQWKHTGSGLPIDPPVITTYSVNYNGNGNNGGTVPTDSNNYFLNSNVAVKGNVGGLTKTQAVFMGFSKNVNAVLTSQASEDAAGIIASFNIAGDTTLYAVWAIDANDNGTPDYKEEPTIPDEPVPGDPGDNKPGEGDGGTDIKDDKVPGNDKPGDNGNDIKDDDVPLGDLPKTGDSNNPWHLVIIMAAAMAGMVYMVFGKKTRKN